MVTGKSRLSATIGYMSEPTPYELLAWNDLVRGQKRLTRRLAESVERKGGDAFVALKGSARSAAERVPAIGQAGKALSKAGAAAANAIPESARAAASDWTSDAAKSALTATARASRVGLSPDRVLAQHHKRGHECETFGDVRSLDLEAVDKVRGRHADIRYAAAGGASGLVAGIMITGGEVGVATGVGSAPGGAVVVGTMAADFAFVFGLASRAVGEVALHYGYDPEEPGEKLFVNSVVNLGTAGSTAAKEAAFADISKLTQLLVRGATWSKLNKSALTRLAQKVAQRIGVRFTQRSLGKLLPVVGAGVGAVMNWAMLEAVVDSANVAYRRRFLLEKYPHLADEIDVDPDGLGGAADVSESDGDAPISISEELPE